MKDERHRGSYKTLRNDVVAFDADGWVASTPIGAPRSFFQRNNGAHPVRQLPQPWDVAVVFDVWPGGCREGRRDVQRFAKFRRLAQHRHRWHTHWVVLGEQAACPGGLKVDDLAGGNHAKGAMDPAHVPLLIDNPDYPVRFADMIEKRIDRIAVPLMPRGPVGPG